VSTTATTSAWSLVCFSLLVRRLSDRVVTGFSVFNLWFLSCRCQGRVHGLGQAPSVALVFGCLSFACVLAFITVV